MAILRLAFDIETQPDESKFDQIPEPTPPAHYKKADTIAAWMIDARQEQLDKAALDPFFSRVMVISLAKRCEDNSITKQCLIRGKGESVDAKSDDDHEKYLLACFWQIIALNRRSNIVTFNGAGFDLPFLYTRSLLLGVRGVKLPIGKYECLRSDGEHFDVCAYLQERGPSNPMGLRRGLQFYAKQVLGIEPSYGADLEKGELGKLWEAGRVDVVTEVGNWDARATLLLAEHVAAVWP